MKRLGRDAAELTALADHLNAHGLVLEMLAGPLPGIYDPTGPGRILFGFFAAMAETERENWGAPRLPDSPSIRMDVWKGEVIASTEEELLSRIPGLGREDGDRDVAPDRP